MELVLNNPYRIVGLLVGATAVQQNRHITRITRFIEAGADVPEEFTAFSFTALGNIKLSIENVSHASSKLNLNSDKIIAALFWFYKGNPITDEPAFDAIKEADLDQVINIWTKLTSNGVVTQRNASAYSNLGTLYLSGILEGTNTNEAILEQGISLKLKFLESDFIKDFKALATDETYKTTKKELQLLFLNQLQSEVEKNGSVTSNKFLDILIKQEFSAKEDFLKGFVQKPIEQIEKKIEETKSKRKANKANSIKAANSLLADTKDSIKQLKSILGTTNIKYASIADKLAMEFFACSRDYFMHFKDTSTDPSEVTMKVFKHAKNIAVGNITMQQIDENIRDLQEWIDDKPTRDKQMLVDNDLKKIISIIDEFDDRAETIANAKLIINKSINYLINIKNILGNTDDLYLKLSTRIAQQAQHNIIEEVNDAQRKAEKSIKFDRFGTINTLKTVLTNAWYATTLIGSLDMEFDFKVNRYNKNKASLKELCNSLDVNTTGSSSSVKTSTSSNGRTTTSSTSSSNSTSPTNSSQSNDNEFPAWLKLAAIVFILFLLAKACE